MDKRTLYITCIAFAIVLIVAGVFYFPNSQRIAKQPGEVSDCKDVENSYLRDACYFQLAVDSKDAAKCFDVANMEQRDLCYIQLSKVNNDASICDLIDDKFFSQPKCVAELKLMNKA